MEFIIKNSRITANLVGNVKEFPKYTTQIMNLANQNVQGKRHRIVCQKSVTDIGKQPRKSRSK